MMLSEKEFIESTEIELPVTTFERTMMIDDETSFTTKFNTLKENLKNYLNILAEYKLTESYNLDNVLNEYATLIMNDVFISDIMAQIEFKNSLNPLQYKSEYFKRLCKNKRIEKCFNDLLISCAEIGININQLSSGLKIKMVYISYNDTNFSNFFDSEIENFLNKTSNFINRNCCDQVFRILQQQLFFIYDLQNNKKQPGFYNECSSHNTNSDYFKSVKTIEYKV